MIDVLATRENLGSLSSTAATNEILLASAFESELSSDRCYLAVPGRLCEQVSKYIDALRDRRQGGGVMAEPIRTTATCSFSSKATTQVSRKSR